MNFEHMTNLGFDFVVRKMDNELWREVTSMYIRFVHLWVCSEKGSKANE